MKKTKEYGVNLMKKISSIVLYILLLVFLQSLSLLNVNASSNNIIFQNDNILSEKEITQIALMDKTLLKDISEVNNITVKKDGNIVEKAIKAGLFEYSQVLKVTQQANDEIITLYSSTIFFFASIVDDESSLMFQDYDSSKHDTGWDGSIGVRASSTIYWTRTYDSYRNLYYVNLVMTDGEWEIFDYQLSITSKKVVVKQGGFYYDGSILKFYNDDVTLYPLSGSFEYYSPVHFEWIPVFTDLSFGMGTFMSCDVVRGGSIWNFEFNNTVVSMV